MRILFLEPFLRYRMNPDLFQS